MTNTPLPRSHYLTNLTSSHPLPVDPTLYTPNPNTSPNPTAPFAPFPPVYPQAQSPIAHTTHTHGIEVLPAFDGTPDTWFTAGGIHGPEFVSNRSEEHTSELQSLRHLVCRLLLEKKKNKKITKNKKIIIKKY